MDISNKKAYSALFLILVFIFIINIISFKNGHSWGGDFAEFIGLAKGIAEGTIDEFMSIHRYRIEHSTLWVHNTDLYWGISFLLTPIYYFFGLDIYVMKIFIYIFFLLSLFIVFLLFKDKLKNLQSLLLVAIIGFNPYFFNFKNQISSDMPYLFFSLLSLFLIKRFVISKKLWINKYISYFFISFILFLSYLIRPVGYVLLPTLLFTQYIHSRYSSKPFKDFIVSEKYKFIPYVIFFILWLISKLILPGGVISGHAGMILNTDISNIILNFNYYLIGPASYFPYFSVIYNVFGLGYDKIHLILYSIILFIALLGMIHNIKDDYLYILYILINAIILIIFPGRDKSHLIPIFPFFMYFLLAGFSKISLSFTLSSKIKFQAINVSYLFAIGLLLISFVKTSHSAYKNIVFNRTEVMDGPYKSDSIEMLNYIKENTKKDDSIIFHKPRVMPLYANRKSFIMSSENFSPEMAFNSDAKYIVLSKIRYTDYELTLQDFHGKLDCEFENNSFLLCDLKK